MQKRSCVGFFPIVDLLAGGACAVIVPIPLRNPSDKHIGNSFRAGIPPSADIAVDVFADVGI
jgi:hypothetical protein